MAKTRLWLIDSIRELNTIDPSILDIREAINHADKTGMDIWLSLDYIMDNKNRIVYDWVIRDRKIKQVHVTKVTITKDRRAFMGYEAKTETLRYGKW